MDEVTQAVEAASVHCSGTQAAARPEAWTSATVSTCADGTAVGMGGLYEGMHAAGLQYGPAFRVLEQAWVSDDGREAVASMRARMHLGALMVHPSDLDGALQLSGALAGSSASGAVKLPFCVDAAACSGRAANWWVLPPCVSRTFIVELAQVSLPQMLKNRPDASANSSSTNQRAGSQAFAVASASTGGTGLQELAGGAAVRRASLMRWRW